jgi:hypothetical protein
MTTYTCNFFFIKNNLPPNFQYVNNLVLGAGNGTFMLNALDYIRDEHPEVYEWTKFRIIEISSSLASLQQQNLMEKASSKGHSDKVEIINRSIFDWDTYIASPCFFVVLEVFDNFAHDAIRMDGEYHHSKEVGCNSATDPSDAPIWCREPRTFRLVRPGSLLSPVSTSLASHSIDLGVSDAEAEVTVLKRSFLHLSKNELRSDPSAPSLFGLSNIRLQWTRIRLRDHVPQPLPPSALCFQWEETWVSRRHSH